MEEHNRDTGALESLSVQYHALTRPIGDFRLLLIFKLMLYGHGSYTYDTDKSR